MIYNSIDYVVNTDDAVHYSIEFLNTLKPPGFSNHRLLLRVSTPIMLLRNLKPLKFCNDTRLQIKALHRNVVKATIISGSGQGEIVFVLRIPLIFNYLPFQFRRLQFL